MPIVAISCAFAAPAVAGTSAQAAYRLVENDSRGSIGQGSATGGVRQRKDTRDKPIRSTEPLAQ